jgi:hypothetical protein
LILGGPIELVREPHNPHDGNAVAVPNIGGQQLGYLKREVAQWFAPILDGGVEFNYTAYRKPESGRSSWEVYEA